MPGCTFRGSYVAAGVLLLGFPLAGQAGMEKPPLTAASDELSHLGYPQDWSSGHLLMPGRRPEDLVAAGARDPRLVYNMVMRQVALEDARLRMPRHRRRIKIDWAVSMENGHVPQIQFPAKYQFGISQENCNSDYVLLGLTVTSGTQANLVGINNLYTTGTPPCNGGPPWVAFAYNTVTQTGGQIRDVTDAVDRRDESGVRGKHERGFVLPCPGAAESDSGAAVAGRNSVESAYSDVVHDANDSGLHDNAQY